jgi:ADP-ribose pyrophosphatase YjhB (NUDIX family)
VAYRERVRTAGYRLALFLLRGWWVLRRPRSSGVRCVLRYRGAILLVRHSYGDRRWMLPGGRVRRGESPVTTARREMHHELRLCCQQWKLTGCQPARAGYRRRSSTDSFRRHSTFYLQGEVETADIDLRRGELSEARWFGADELPDDRYEGLDVAASAGWLSVGR